MHTEGGGRCGLQRPLLLRHSGHYRFHLIFTITIVNCQGKQAACANNCKGVDPNSIIGGGVAAVALSGIAATGAFGPVLGLGVVGAAGKSVTSRHIEEDDGDLCISRPVWWRHVDEYDAENSMSLTPVPGTFGTMLLLCDSGTSCFVSSKLLGSSVSSPLLMYQG